MGWGLHGVIAVSFAILRTANRFRPTVLGMVAERTNQSNVENDAFGFAKALAALRWCHEGLLIPQTFLYAPSRPV